MNYFIMLSVNIRTTLTQYWITGYKKACLAVLRQHCIHTAQQDAIQSNRKTVCQDCVSIASILHDRMLSSVTGSLFGSIASGLYPYCMAG